VVARIPSLHRKPREWPGAGPRRNRKWQGGRWPRSRGTHRSLVRAWLGLDPLAHELVKDFNPSGESMTGNPQGNPLEPEQQQIEYEAAAATTRIGLCVMRCSEPPFAQGSSSSTVALRNCSPRRPGSRSLRGSRERSRCLREVTRGLGTQWEKALGTAQQPGRRERYSSSRCRPADLIARQACNSNRNRNR
jgi:hypothetical protein